MTNPPDDVNGGFVDPGTDESAHPGQWRIAQAPVVKIAISELRAARSPRLSGENPDHVRALAQTEGKLPPIIVHRPSMRVIDGMHRLRAAQQCDEDEIEVRFFDGTDTEAFVLAVRSNIAHGLPLSVADRKAAAVRIVAANPQWSDRMIASRTGLAAKTIASLRDGSDERPETRIGQDGKVRPVSSTAGRALASELIADNPDLSLRQVAREAGISPETVRDVRGRLRRGEDPLLPRQRRREPEPAPPAEDDQAGEDHDGAEFPLMVRELRADPALRLNAAGRVLLKILNANTVINNKFDSILENVPAHCRGTLAQAARECAQVWRSFALHLEP